MTAYDAYCIALKNPAFKAAAKDAHHRVEMGYAPAVQFPFIINNHVYFYGCRSVFDEMIPGYVVAPFYYGGRPVRRGHTYGMRKAIIIN